jgi:SAM-dependent methyltransferase
MPEDYLMANIADATELKRLQIQEGFWDPPTQRILGDYVGVQPGWRCLELGAGAGSILRWLADRVGPAGAVVAADVDTRFLVDLPTNVEVRTIDAGEADFGLAEYDLAHHRAILSFVPSRDEVLPKLVRAIRPGGWLVSEEPIFVGGNSVLTGDDDGLLAAAFDGQLAMLEELGTDVRFGERLPLLFDGLQLAQIGNEGRYEIAQGGDGRWSEVWALYVDGLRGQFTSKGHLTDDQIDLLIKQLQRRALKWKSINLVAAWGQRLRTATDT